MAERPGPRVTPGHAPKDGPAARGSIAQSPGGARFAPLACKIAPMDEQTDASIDHPSGQAAHLGRRVAVSCAVIALVAASALCLSLVAAAAYFTLAG